ncbi:MAG: hypothetical protein IJT73_04220, partial [Selenomonadaceae bacterium]|nr:hypothetical protein [Selenomonadaceae bacterium]
MITEKPFTFDLQLFALPEVATIGAADGNVQITGSDDTTAYSFNTNEATSSDNAAQITSDTTANAATTLESGSWIKGGGLSSNQLSLEGVGDIVNFSESTAVQLSTEDDNLAVTDLEGTVSLNNLVDNSFKQTIKGAEIDATFDENNDSLAVSYSDELGGLALLNNGDITLNSVDENQIWETTEDKSINYDEVTVKAQENGYIVTKSGEGDFLKVYSPDSEDVNITIQAENDKSLEVEGAVLTGVNALNNSKVTANSDEVKISEVAGGEFSVDDWNLNLNSGDEINYSNSNGELEISSEYAEAVTVEGAADKNLNLNQKNSSAEIAANVNGADINVADDSDGVQVALEDGGISAVSDIDEGAAVKISGDDSFTLNEDYTVETSNDFNATVESSMLNVAVASGDNLNVTGGNVDFEVASGSATVNGEEISLQSTDNAKISMNDSDLTAVALKVGDSISNTSDKVFEVTYDSSNVDADTDYVLSVNDTSISVKGSAFEGDTATLNFTEDGTVEITGLSTDSTITATAGTYKIIDVVEEVTITEGIGYITGSGDDTTTGGGDDTTTGGGDDTTTGGGSINKAALKRLTETAQKVINDINNLETTVPAFNVYSNLTDEISSLPESIQSAQVAGYETATDTLPTASSVSGGINISVNTDKQIDSTTTLGDTDNLRHIKLDSALADDVIIAEPEGDSIWSSIIDVSGSTRNTLVAVGTGNENSYVNHTIIGSSYDGATGIIRGEKALGNDYVQAGNGGAYIYNAGAKSTLKGGNGTDLIFAGKNDYVEGGKGADYFYDSNNAQNNGGYTVGDYNISDGDVIVATNLSADDSINSKTFKFSKDAVAIAGGNRITLANGENQLIFTDASAKKNYNLVWADKNGGEVNAEGIFDSDTGVIIVTDQNGNRADKITGSVKSDTIFAGGNDTIYGGDGKDKIYLKEATGNEYGTAVDLGDTTKDSKEVNDWSFGFEKSNNLVIGNAEELSYHVTKNDNLDISSENGSLILIADDNASRDKFDVLIGDSKYNPEKVSVVKNKVNATVESNDELADLYYADGKHSSLTFAENVAKDISFSNNGTESDILYLSMNNNSHATIYGNSGSEHVTLGGSNSAHSSKVISLGGGNDKIYSGGSDTSTAGHTILFGEGEDGIDTIYNYGYYQGKKADVLKKGADVLSISNWDLNDDGTGETAIYVTKNNVAITVNSSSVVNISGTVSTDNMIMLKLNGEAHVAKFGLSNNKQGNEFTYDTEADFYYGDTKHSNDKLTVDSNTTNAEIYLDNSQDAKYYGITEIDASTAKGRLVLFGNSSDNVITSGGANASLWGGNGGDDELIGSDARDTFFFTANSGNDTVKNFDNGVDKVIMSDVTL